MQTKPESGSQFRPEAHGKPGPQAWPSVRGVWQKPSAHTRLPQQPAFERHNPPSPAQSATQTPITQLDPEQQLPPKIPQVWPGFRHWASAVEGRLSAPTTTSARKSSKRTRGAAIGAKLHGTDCRRIPRMD